MVFIFQVLSFFESDRFLFRISDFWEWPLYFEYSWFLRRVFLCIFFWIRRNLQKSGKGGIFDHTSKFQNLFLCKNFLDQFGHTDWVWALAKNLELPLKHRWEKWLWKNFRFFCGKKSCHVNFRWLKKIKIHIANTLDFREWSLYCR